MYGSLPELNIDYLNPSIMRVGMIGAGIDGGRNGLDDAPAIDFSGGGKISITYDECMLIDPEQHEYFNWLSTYLDGSMRSIVVPIVTDRVGPFPTFGQEYPQPFISGIRHMDGSIHTDGSGYTQASVFGSFESDATVGAGQVAVNIFGASRHLRWSDWMSTHDAVRGWRAWRYWKCSDPVGITRTVEGETYDGYQYTLSISPPLRMNVVAGQRIELARPKFAARLPRGVSLDWEIASAWMSRPTLQFVESEVR